MKAEVILNEIKLIHKIDDYWTNDNYIKLLEEFDFPDAAQTNLDELWEMLQMAISDFEPNEAAEVILNYKLGNRLNKGQIQNISHEMQEDNLAEEYADISFHYDFFNINQLLYDAYNGKFPHAEAIKITLTLLLKSDHEIEVNEEIILKSLIAGLDEHNLLHRLFDKQLKGESKFKEAEDIIWELKNLGDHKYQIITSEYWINKEDILQKEFSSSILFHEEE